MWLIGERICSPLRYAFLLAIIVMGLYITPSPVCISRTLGDNVSNAYLIHAVTISTNTNIELSFYTFEEIKYADQQ